MEDGPVPSPGPPACAPASPAGSPSPTCSAPLGSHFVASVCPNCGHHLVRPFCTRASHSPANASAAAAPKASDRRSQHKFHKLFNLDQDEPLVKSFPCALVGDILFQGTFYASEHFFCFHSKFAKKRKLIQIAIREVTNLTREKTAGIIPNAIALHTKHTRFMFASIIGRENILRLLTNLWETQLSVSNTLKWVSNDGVIHDSSVDTELDTEEEDEAEEELPLQVACLDGAAPALPPQSTPAASGSLGAPAAQGTPEPRPRGDCTPSKPACRRRRTPGGERDLASAAPSASFPLRQCLHDLWSLPRIQLCLLIAYIILIFLAFSAIVLAWRVHTYQAFLQERIDNLDTSSHFEPYCRPDDAQCNLYRLRQQTHSSRIRHVQSVMNSNIRTLNDLARRLRIPQPGQADDRPTSRPDAADGKEARAVPVA